MTVTAIPPQTSAEAADAPAGRGGMKKIAMILIAVLALGGGGYWYLLRPTPPAAPEAGAVLRLDAIQVNLAAAHYMRLGLALQLTTKAEDRDGSMALDAAISLFSGRTITEVNNPKKREALKTELEDTLAELYEGDVMGVYFTEFVTQ